MVYGIQDYDIKLYKVTLSSVAINWFAQSEYCSESKIERDDVLIIDKLKGFCRI